MDNRKRAYFYAVGAVLCWSTVASAFKISLRRCEVLPLLFFSSVTSTFVILVFLLFTGRLSFLRLMKRQDYFRSAGLGFLCPFLYYIVLFGAYSKLPAQEALTLNFVWPIVLVLLSIPLLGQKIGLKSIIAVVISFSGVYVIATEGEIFGFQCSCPRGISLALGSSFIWALFWIFSLADKRDELVGLFLNFVFGSCFLFVAVLLFSGLKAPGSELVLAAGYIGTFEMSVTFILWLKALKLSRTTAYVANLIYLVPFLSIVCIHFTVGEAILPSTLIGLVLIVAGILMQNITAKTNKRQRRLSA